MMMSENVIKKILIVDDEEFNLDILNEYLHDAGYQTIVAKNGREAIYQLEVNMPIDAIVLDRMMPVMDGMQFLKTVRSKDAYKHIPVIMQTAAGSPEQIVEGIAAGVFYYLTKPYERAMLLTILNSALEHKISQHMMKAEILTHRNAMKLMEHAEFRFRTMDEAKHLSYTVSNAFDNSEKAVFGLSELTTNAVEHGNLGINFEEKRSFVIANKLKSEIEKRLGSPQYSSNYATLTFNNYPTHHEVRIKDMGNGFDFKKYLSFEPSRLTDPNGRGIAMAKIYSFDEIEYLGNGSEVVCRIKKG